MKLIKGVCLGQKHAETGKKKKKKSERKIISTEDGWYIIIMKNIDLCDLPDKLNS